MAFFFGVFLLAFMNNEQIKKKAFFHVLRYEKEKANSCIYENAKNSRKGLRKFLKNSRYGLRKKVANGFSKNSRYCSSEIVALGMVSSSSCLRSALAVSSAFGDPESLVADTFISFESDSPK